MNIKRRLQPFLQNLFILNHFLASFNLKLKSRESQVRIEGEPSNTALL